MSMVIRSDVVKSSIGAITMGARAARPPVDLVHLARQTFGSADLEREVLQLFVRQGAPLVARIREASIGERGALVHRLKGSARSIGAHRVAEITEALEAPDLAEGEARHLIDDLEQAVGDVARFVRSLF